MISYMQDARSYSYYVELSNDEVSWTKVVDYTHFCCRSWQEIYFSQCTVQFIRVQIEPNFTSFRGTKKIPPSNFTSWVVFFYASLLFILFFVGGWYTKYRRKSLGCHFPFCILQLVLIFGPFLNVESLLSLGETWGHVLDRFPGDKELRRLSGDHW